ncbi:MAG: hypothetical protein ABI836_04895 [Gemmatimonadota bacterium]
MLIRILVFLGTAGLAAPLAAQQAPARLSMVLTAFLADSGVATRGLPWTTGSALPVQWATRAPVAAEAWARQKGFTMARAGTVRIKVGTHEPVEMALQLFGNNAGLQQVIISVNLQESDELQHGEMRTALAAEGMTLTPLKCDEKKEGASYGNLVFVAKAPGKTPSGLHENWDCSMNGCGWSMTLLYRKADVAPIECYSG